MTNSQRRLAAIGVALLALVGVAWWRLRPGPSLEDVARSAIRGFETQNPSLILPHLQQEEIAALGLTEAKLSAVLSRARSIRSLSARTESLVLQKMPESGTLMARSTCAEPDGRRLTFEVLATETESGPKVLSFVYSVAMHEVSSKLQPEGKRTGAAKIAKQVEVLPELAKEYGHAGIPGLYFADPTNSRFITWGQLEVEWRERLAKATAQEQARG